MDKLRILVVDDEYGMRRGAVKALRNYTINLEEPSAEISFEIDQAANGIEALEKLNNHVFDLVLLDYKMPELSGLDVLEAIREKKLDVLVVMVTAYASLEVAVSATKNGAYDFLAKPFTPDELKSVVKKACRSLVAQRKAKELSAEKRRVRFQFISVLAHELKAPLAAVDSYLQLMKSHTAGEELVKYDHIVERSLIRIEGMRKMILDLLDLTRIESGQKKRDIKPVSLYLAAQNAIEMVRLSAEDRNIQIHLDGSETYMFEADEGEIEIIFNNLLSNAVKYNRENGHVDVTITGDSAQVVIQVKDTGIGMSVREQENLFGEFSRIKNEHTRNIMGSGLGLSILKKLVSWYDGTIRVNSKKGSGSTFEITLKTSQKQNTNAENE